MMRVPGWVAGRGGWAMDGEGEMMELVPGRQHMGDWGHDLFSEWFVDRRGGLYLYILKRWLPLLCTYC